MNNSNYIQETETVQKTQKYYSYIYEIRHVPTGKLYVGSRCAQSVLKKFEDCYTDKYMGSSKRKEGPFSKSDIKKNRQDYQKTVLKVFYSEDINAAHRQEHGENGLIATYLQQYGDDICLNQHYYKNCGTKVWSTAGQKLSEEHKLKKIETWKNKSEEEKEEIRLKKSEACKGKNKGKNPYTNKSEEEMIEIRRKLSEAMKGKNKGKNPYANKSETELAEIRLKKSEASSGEKNPRYGKSPYEYKNENEMIEIKHRRSKTNKILCNIKYRCPYDNYIQVASEVSKYMKKNHSDKKQWKDYTKEEKEQFKI